MKRFNQLNHISQLCERGILANVYNQVVITIKKEDGKVKLIKESFIIIIIYQVM